MPPRPRIPAVLLTGPFTRAMARAHGLSDRQLQSSAWVRILPGVWCHRDAALGHADLIEAARLALPARARVSHVTRIQELGLDIGPREPRHFTLAGDHHLDLPGVFLHRTEVMPPHDDAGVSPAAAFIQCCADLRLLDLIIIGDWLLAMELTTREEIAHRASLQSWRPGARQTRHVLHHLDDRSRSPRESEVRALALFAGLPAPEVNAEIDRHGVVVAIIDLLYRRWSLALEYEGRQHAESPEQFNRDISRYALLREMDIAYLQITAEMLRKPRSLVTRIHQMLVKQGYDGPAPIFANRWASLFAPVRPH